MQVQYFKWICYPNACYRFTLLDPVPFLTCPLTFQTVVAADHDPSSYFLCCSQRRTHQLSRSLQAAKSRHLFDLNLAHFVGTRHLYHETAVIRSLLLFPSLRSLCLYSCQNSLGRSGGHV